MSLLQELARNITRRHFFARGSDVVGWAAISSLIGLANDRNAPAAQGLISQPTQATHHVPKAKHVIYLHMVGGPPQMDLYDYKPMMADWYDKDLPETVRMGQR